MLRLIMSTDRRDGALQTIRASLERTRAASACADCQIYISADEPSRILYLEEWTSEDELAKHLRSDCWKGILAVMEAAAEQPHIRFIWSDKSRGLDYLHEQRLGLATDQAKHGA